MSELGGKVKRGFAWDMAGSLFNQVSGLLITIFLARLLTPEEFGVVALAMVFISLTSVFTDVGFTQGLIQREKVDNGHYNSIFLVNISLSFVMGGIIYLSAGMIGDFYDSEEVVHVVKYLSLIPIIASFGMVHRSILVRKMKFKELSLRTAICSVFGGIIGITAAFYGEGAFSLVWKQLASELIGVIVFWWGSKWIPDLRFSMSKVKDLFSFSQFVFFDALVRTFFDRLDTLFIGKVFSPEILGLFGRAKSLNLIVSDYTTNSIRKVMFPALSSIQHEPKRFNTVFLRIVTISSAGSVLLAGIMFFIAEPFILIVLGEQWKGAISIFKILVFVTLVSPHIGINAQAILSRGFSKTKLYMNGVHRSLALMPMIIGFFYGIEIFTLTLVLVKFTVLFVYILFAQKKLQISWWEQWKRILITFIPFLAFIVLFHFLTPFAYQLFDISHLYIDVIKAFLFAVVYLGYLKTINHELYNLLWDIISKGKKWIHQIKRK
jgi:O-antigen/teichoic acid export membrane protein